MMTHLAVTCAPMQRGFGRPVHDGTCRCAGPLDPRGSRAAAHHFPSGVGRDVRAEDQRVGSEDHSLISAIVSSASPRVQRKSGQSAGSGEITVSNMAAIGIEASGDETGECSSWGSSEARRAMLNLKEQLAGHPSFNSPRTGNLRRIRRAADLRDHFQPEGMTL